MARYLDITREIAARVISGELSPGAELPSVRVLAQQHHTTPSTVSRAYRHLADAGVIAQSDRRRGRIAPDALLGRAPAARRRPRISPRRERRPRARCRPAPSRSRSPGRRHPRQLPRPHRTLARRRRRSGDPPPAPVRRLQRALCGRTTTRTSTHPDPPLAPRTGTAVTTRKPQADHGRQPAARPPGRQTRIRGRHSRPARPHPPRRWNRPPLAPRPRNPIPP